MPDQFNLMSIWPVCHPRGFNCVVLRELMFLSQSQFGGAILLLMWWIYNNNILANANEIDVAICVAIWIVCFSKRK